MFTAQIDGKEVELKASDLTPQKGYAIITPDKIPDGYYNEEGLQTRVQERIRNTAENARNEALKDPKFQKQVLKEFNISLDKNGKPAGLEPTVDIDQVRSEERKQVAEEKDAEIERIKEQLSNRDRAVIENAILASTNGKFEDHWLESVDGEKPLIVEKFWKKLGVDENGDPFIKNENEEKTFKNDGTLLKPKDYFGNEDIFGKHYKDQRQRGSNFAGQGNPNSGRPRGNPAQWDRSKKLEFIAENGQEGYKKALQQFKAEPKED